MSIPSDSHLPEDEQSPAEISENNEQIKQVDEEESQPAEMPQELPPEAQGEANGGPLGCCLGTVIGLLLTFLLITGGSLVLANGGFLGIATLPVAIVGAVVGGILGWIIGKHIYREYELSPRQKARLARLEKKYQKR